MEIEQTLSLPEEIIGEILSRIPVKSLLKFRCVSKSWRSLIDSKRFIKTHLQNSTKNTSIAHHRIILNSFSAQHCSLNSLLNETFTDSFTIDDSINIERESVHLVGCCNGLVCFLLNRKDFILWNPSTRMSKNLPEIDDNLMHGNITTYGFGYDESSGDYKVFGAMLLFWADGRRLAISKLYSLKTNSWKTTMEMGNITLSDARGKFACGKFHWLTSSGLDCGIVSFDLKSEVYGMVEQPSYSEGGFNGSLGVLGGCLCLLCDYQKRRIDVWVMKHYGVKESWAKVATVPHLHGLPKSPLCIPFCIGPNGEVLLTYLSNFIVYYPKDNGVRMIKFVPFQQADMYVESLVSLVCDGEQELRNPESVA